MGVSQKKASYRQMWENKQSAYSAHASNEKVRDAVVSEDRLRENTFKKCDLHVHSGSCYSRP